MTGDTDGLEREEVEESASLSEDDDSCSLLAAEAASFSSAS